MKSHEVERRITCTLAWTHTHLEHIIQSLNVHAVELGAKLDVAVILQLHAAVTLQLRRTCLCMHHQKDVHWLRVDGGSSGLTCPCVLWPTQDRENRSPQDHCLHSPL